MVLKIECASQLPGGLVKTLIAGPTPTGSISASLGSGLRICMSKSSQVMLLLSDFGSYFEDHWWWINLVSHLLGTPQCLLRALIKSFIWLTRFWIIWPLLFSLASYLIPSLVEPFDGLYSCFLFHLLWLCIYFSICLELPTEAFLHPLTPCLFVKTQRTYNLRASISTCCGTYRAVVSVSICTSVFFLRTWARWRTGSCISLSVFLGPSTVPPHRGNSMRAE